MREESKLEKRSSIDVGSAGRTQAQWVEERKFFNELALAVDAFDLPRIESRYSQAIRNPLYPLEYAYALMGTLNGLRVLDVGCGHGEHSLLFARWGAQVTGVDISERAIEVCNSRSRQFSLEGSLTLFACPFESLAPAESEKFDVIWSCAFLHHVLDRLPEVIAKFRDLLRPNGFVIFMEPVRLSAGVKSLRAIVPLAAAGTPGERPLEAGDLACIAKEFSFDHDRRYGPLSRLVDRAHLSDNYETAPRWRRQAADLLYRVDRFIMKPAVSRRLAMIQVARLDPR